MSDPSFPTGDLKPDPAESAKLARKQANLPETCLLPGMLILGLYMTGEDPCAGCNHNRADCGGRPKRSGGF